MRIDPDLIPDFVPPGLLSLSHSALEYARPFCAMVKNRRNGYWVAVIDWATSTKVRMGPDEAEQEIGPGLALTGFKQNQVPPQALHSIDGVEFAIYIPKDVWENSAQRLIDYDENLLFKLVLR